MRRTLAVVAIAGLLGATAAAVAHAVVGRSGSLALPELHGQMTWTPGTRIAPKSIPRGRTAVLAFVAPGCTGCLAELRYAIDRLAPSIRPTVVRRAVARNSLVLLVDRRGSIRTGYMFPFAPAFVEGDLRALAR